MMMSPAKAGSSGTAISVQPTLLDRITLHCIQMEDYTALHSNGKKCKTATPHSTAVVAVVCLHQTASDNHFLSKGTAAAIVYGITFIAV